MWPRQAARHWAPMLDSYEEAEKISDEEALAGLTREQLAQYDQLLDALLALDAAMVVRGKWPRPVVTNKQGRASLSTRDS